MTSTRATVKVIGDRIHEINSLLPGYNAQRYFPQNMDSAKLPMLVTVPGAVTRPRANSSEDARVNRRSFTLICFCGNFTQGIPQKSAQIIAEQAIADIEDLYDARNRLQLNGNDAPDAIIHSDYEADTGLTLYPGTELAAVLFTLTVESDRYVEIL